MAALFAIGQLPHLFAPLHVLKTMQTQQYANLDRIVLWPKLIH